MLLLPDAARCGGVREGQSQFFRESPSGLWFIAQFKTIPAVGKWVHLAGTWDGAMRRICVNGILKGMEGTAPQRPPAMGHLTLGRGGAYDGRYTAGELDDVRIISRTPATAR